MLPPVLSTTRTTLRPFALGEAEALLALFQTPEVRRYLLDDAVVTLDWMRQEIHTSTARFADTGAGLWSVRDRATDALLGFAGFRPFFDPPQLQLLYGLHPDHWGGGLATEAAACVCTHAFAHLGFVEILAAVDRPNVASVHVLNRLGMVHTHTTDDGEAGTLFFRLTSPR
ncbi:MAG: GNAT family N-acetyltransferase [Bacteroidota bacterium]